MAAVEMAKQLRRASPKTVVSAGRYARSAPSSLRAGYLNKRGRSLDPS
jgi:hypothetical protein